jgi:hypothetical protein
MPRASVIVLYLRQYVKFAWGSFPPCYSRHHDGFGGLQIMSVFNVHRVGTSLGGVWEARCTVCGLRACGLSYLVYRNFDNEVKTNPPRRRSGSDRWLHRRSAGPSSTTAPGPRVGRGQVYTWSSSCLMRSFLFVSLSAVSVHPSKEAA